MPPIYRETTLTVMVKNVQIGKGTVYVQVWADEETFFKKPLLTQSLKAERDSLMFTFSLMEGRYALSLYQDLNDNQKLDLGMFRIPKEPVAFGNNFRPKFSAPTFNDCAVSLDSAMQVEIVLK